MQLIKILIAEMNADWNNPGSLQGARLRQEQIPVGYGAGARPIEPSWVLSIRDQCQSAGIPFFSKQWGGVNKKKAGRELESRLWDELPALVAKM